ncbi:wax ester/triacylglycerol synthase domain-containing protein [Streptomyces sp. NPDC006134]|uniref:wax ester/triacylglycerol synthase domain-containing protein n=1 Tax=Streptomyces sp. NPDC006134 TaxID=3154467 RepID=UPI0033E66E86
MTTRSAQTTGPVDRYFLRNGTACGFVLDFDGPAPPAERLAARVVRRAASHATLSSLPPPPGRYRWTSRQEPLRQDAHVRHVACCDDGAMTEAVRTLLDQPLPRPPHPPWDVRLLHVPGRPGFRIVYRVHHALQDGVGAAHTLLALLADRAAEGPRPHRAAPPTVAGALLAGRSCLAVLRPAKGWDVLRRAPSQRTRWVCADVPEPRVRELARRYGVTVNDVCLAGLAGALGRWHGTLRTTPHPHPAPKLPVLLPMSFRQDHQRYAPGTLTTVHRLTLPCHLSGLEQALRPVHRQTRALRGHRVRDASRLALRLLPAALGHRAAGAVLGERAAPLIVSSVTLPAGFTCFDGTLSAASLISDLCGGRLGYLSFTRAAGVVRCGLVHDAALPGASAVPALWREAVAGGAARP